MKWRWFYGLRRSDWRLRPIKRGMHKRRRGRKQWGRKQWDR